MPCVGPEMDGPVIRAATEQSLATGFRLRDVFLAARLLSAASSVNLLIMTYWGPVAAYGPQRFAGEARDAGAAGVIVPNLPAEEAPVWLAAARSAGIHPVPLPRHGADDAELARIGTVGGGMLYATGLPGLTGSTSPLADDLEVFVRRARDLTALPVGVGIGVCDPECPSGQRVRGRGRRRVSPDPCLPADPWRRREPVLQLVWPPNWRQSRPPSLSAVCTALLPLRQVRGPATRRSKKRRLIMGTISEDCL
ncbi:tryptophan synthase subunit alpha [Streptomyces sp. NPDC006854]|uniref:tryptophan synthase subunit alpha n=1 Tax=Streptomyces sp. NPDC006854 TaxID=3155115 RepID=UPI0033C443C9